MFPIRVRRQKKSSTASLYISDQKDYRAYKDFLYLFHSFTNNFSNYFESLKPFVKAFFVRPTCQDKSSPSLSIDSIAASKTVDCFFFPFSNCLWKDLD